MSASITTFEQFQTRRTEKERQKQKTAQAITTDKPTEEQELDLCAATMEQMEKWANKLPGTTHATIILSLEFFQTNAMVELFLMTLEYNGFMVDPTFYPEAVELRIRTAYLPLVFPA